MASGRKWRWIRKGRAWDESMWVRESKSCLAGVDAVVTPLSKHPPGPLHWRRWPSPNPDSQIQNTKLHPLSPVWKPSNEPILCWCHEDLGSKSWTWTAVGLGLGLPQQHTGPKSNSSHTEDPLFLKDLVCYAVSWYGGSCSSGWWGFQDVKPICAEWMNIWCMSRRGGRVKVAGVHPWGPTRSLSSFFFVLFCWFEQL